MKRIFICLLLLAPCPLLAQTPAEERLAAADQAVDRARAAADRPALVRALGDLGRAQLGVEDSTAALASFRLALKLAREAEDQPAIAGNLLEMYPTLVAANDLVFRTGMDAPTIRIDGMTVAGI